MNQKTNIIMEKLKFGKGNAKLGKKVMTFSLPAGYSCPFAKDCLSKADKDTGTLTDGKHTQFRCFSASSESIYKNTRIAHWHNYDALKGLKTEQMAELINASIPKNTGMVRIHVSGDFFNQAYFDAWMLVANINPAVVFYAYTKSIGYWVERLGSIPANLKLTASFGGKNDKLIEKHNLKSARVVYSYAEAEELGLEIDHDDSHAFKTDYSFALIIHGGQPKGSAASKAKQALKKEGWEGYTKKNKKAAA